GCGIMFHIPHEFFVEEGKLHGFDLPAPGEYGGGMIFLPRDRESRESCIQILNKAILEEDQELIGWRDVPRDSSTIVWLARENEPVIRQVFIGRGEGLDIEAFERKLFTIRKAATHMIGNSVISGK